MADSEVETSWEAQYQQVVREVAAWRKEHPRATFTEIERMLDERLNRLRAQMLGDTAAMGREEAEGTAVCPECGQEVRGRGEKRRRLQTQGGESVTLERQHAICEQCGRSFFPPG